MRFAKKAVFLYLCLHGMVLARAETLDEALTTVYQFNPQLLAQRMQGKVIGETLPQALAGWRPSVSLDVKEGRGRYENNSLIAQESVRVTHSGNVTITQPVYRGGRTVAATKQAMARIDAESFQLTNVEQTILQEAVKSYLDVVRDQAVLELNINNEQVLQRQLEATRDRFRVGEVTQTDISQAEARLSRAAAARLASSSDLQVSKAIYERIIGTTPDSTLAFPSRPPNNLPLSLQEVIESAMENPLVGVARYAEKAAQHGIDLVRGELFPTVNLVGVLSRNWTQGTRDLRSETAEVMLRVNVPIYQQGLTYSRLREAKYTANQRRLEFDYIKRAATETATQAWEELQSTLAQIHAFQTQVMAATIALDGVKHEAQVGSRTVLDVLNAGQELVDAKVSLIRARRDSLQAEYQLLSAIGKMTAKNLGLFIEDTRSKSDVPSAGTT